MKKVSALDLAKYIIKVKSKPELGEYITNLKLQKILYYVQGFHLAFFDMPIFDEDVQAWMYGPVVESVYNEYKDNGSLGIKNLYEDFDFTDFLESDQNNLVESVWEVYGQYSAGKLVDLTHGEPPRAETTNNGVTAGNGVIIDKDLMKKYFLTQVDA